MLALKMRERRYSYAEPKGSEELQNLAYEVGDNNPTRKMSTMPGASSAVIAPVRDAVGFVVIFLLLVM